MREILSTQLATMLQFVVVPRIVYLHYTITSKIIRTDKMPTSMKATSLKP